MEWSAVISDPLLAELPFQLELNEWGKIEMSPANNAHGLLQAAIVFLLKTHLPTGKTVVECSIQTDKNVKVADVVWCSPAFFRQHGMTTPYAVAPEIVIEIVSPSNSVAELIEKKALYIARGAQEVWLCNENGQMVFYHQTAQLANSVLCPAFPLVIEM